MCNPKLTINENRVRASSQFFKSACKAGPWVNDFHADEELSKLNICRYQRYKINILNFRKEISKFVRFMRQSEVYNER